MVEPAAPDMSRDRDEDDRDLLASFLESGALAWRCSDAGVAISLPNVSDPLERWIRSPELSRRVAVVIGAAGDNSPHPTELFPGCQIVAFGGPGTPSRIVALQLRAGATGGPAFEQICASAHVPATDVAAALEPFVRHDVAGLPPGRAIASLRYLWNADVRRRRDAVTLDQFGQKLAQAFEEINLFFRLAELLNCEQSPHEVFRLYCEHLRQTLAFGWLAVALDPAATRVPGAGERLISAGALPCPAEPLRRAAIDMSRRTPLERWSPILVPADSALASLAGAPLVTQPVAPRGGHVVGTLLAGNKGGADPEVTSADLQFLAAAADFLGIFHQNLGRLAEQKTLFLGTLRALTASIDAKDAYTRGHSERVALLSSSMARALGMDSSIVEQYRIAGLVHDVGKIGTPEAILTKVGRLTPDEFEEIKRHPVTGYNILRGIPGLDAVLPGVLHHHERFDGGGYPHRLAGSSIPPIARVLTLADTFDAMRSSRSYRSAMGDAAAIAEIRRCAGTHFDPELAAVFTTLDFAEFEQMLPRPSDPIAA